MSGKCFIFTMPSFKTKYFDVYIDGINIGKYPQGEDLILDVTQKCYLAIEINGKKSKDIEILENHITKVEADYDKFHDECIIQILSSDEYIPGNNRESENTDHKVKEHQDKQNTDSVPERNRIFADIYIKDILIFLLILYTIFVAIQYIQIYKETTKMVLIIDGMPMPATSLDENVVIQYCITKTFRRCAFVTFALIICVIVLTSMAKRQFLEISSEKIIGKSSLLNKIDDTVDGITDVKLRAFIRAITITTTSGKITLWAIKNRYEIYDNIKSLIRKNKQNHSSN